MKSLLVFAFMMMAGLSAGAAQSVEEFTQGFVAATNDHIAELNEQRAAEGKKLYCSALNDKQVALIAKVASTPEITVKDFVETVSDSLECYEPFWSQWGHKDSIRGILFNTKSYVLDNTLINESMVLFAGRDPNIYEKVLEVAAPSEF